MKQLVYKIYNDVSESFLYMGHLFLLTGDRKLKCIHQNKLFARYLSINNDRANTFLIDLYFNNQGLSYKSYASDKEYKDFLDALWQNQSKQKREFSIEGDDLQTICDLPENEPLDFIIYAQKAFLGNRDGVFECQLVFNDFGVSSDDGFKRIFDCKSINLNARVGHVLISTKKEGLFNGYIELLKDKLKISDRAIQEQSVRTGWANYNFVNYKSPTQSEYFINDTEIDNSEEASQFKTEDGGKTNLKITVLGTQKYELDKEAVVKEVKEEIVFSFNSLANSFLLTQAGSIFYSPFTTDNYQIGRLGHYRKFKDIKLDIDQLGYPLSAHTVSNGTVYEFFNKVILIKNGVVEVISNIECKQIRTFASSKWYRNTITALSEDCLEIHTVHPFM